MDSLATMIFDFAGRPRQPGVEPSVGSCWYCGAALERGMPVSTWAGEGFNAYARAQRRADPTATTICEACVFVCSRLSPVPFRPAKAGKKLGGNYRNYSHAAERSPSGVRYVNANKAEVSTLVTFLRDAGQCGRWAMAVASSGQKHVIPHAVVNEPGQRTAAIAFEELTVRVQIDQLLALVAEADALRVASRCSADAIATGSYHPKDLQRALGHVREFEAKHARLRGGGVLELAAFLTTAPPK